MITILRIRPGDDETRIFEYTGVDVTGYTATATFSVGSVTVTRTTANGGITVDGENSEFTVVLTDAHTTQLATAGWLGTMRLRVTSPTGEDATLVRAALVVL